MKNRYILSRKNRLRVKKQFVLFMIVLIFSSGMLPSLELMSVSANSDVIEEPAVSKDIEGENEKEIIRGEEYNYNVNISLPENISGYKFMEVSDDLDKRLAVKDTAVLIDGEVDGSLKATVDGQKVSLELTQDQLMMLVGNNIELQITTQVQEDVALGEEIENIAQVVLNDNVVLKTNPAVVTPVETEEMQKSEQSAAKEDEKVDDKDKESNDTAPVKESDKVDGKDKKSSDTTPDKKSDDQVVEENDNFAATKKSDASLRQVQTTAAFDINHTDSYGITWEAPGVIYQFDGNNPSATPKASLTVRGVAADKHLNGLALSKYNNRFYASTGNQLYLIDSTGASLHVANLVAPSGNGVMSQDGTKYHYSYEQNGKIFLGTYNIANQKHEPSVEVKGLGSEINSLGGDLFVDADGLMWFTNGGRLIQFNPTDGNVTLNTELPTDDPHAGGRGLSFLPDGRLLVAGGVGPAGNTNNVEPMLYIYDPKLHEVSYLGKITGSKVIVDLASAVTPHFAVPTPGELRIIKEDEADGTRLQGATFELKDADDNKVGDLVTNENGEGVLQNLEAGNYTLVETVAPEGYKLLNEAIEVTMEIDKPTIITIKNTKVFDPVLESSKSATLEKKAEGNTDTDNPEVGDTIRYTITTKNTIEDSLVENLVITDEIPEGLTYVAGSLEVNGESVTDSADKDAGHVVDNNVTGNFGDITDTKDYTVTFLVTVDEGQAGKDITNIAEITGDNTDIDEPEEEVKVYPREPVLESEKSAQNLEEGKEKFEVGDTVVYTIQTRNTVSDGVVENLVITDELPEGLEFVEGSLSVSHDGEATFTDGVITANFGDVTDTEWRKVTFEAKVLAGQSGKEIENTATVDGDNIDEPDEPTTTVTVEPKDPKLESNKSSTLEKKAEGNTDADNPEVGDTIRYTITTKNTIEDSLVENLVITDEIPEGLTYVAGSLEVNGESVTDSADKDAGHVVDNNVTGNFGDITDTKDYTVTFLVTVDEGQAGKDITNIAEITGDNTDIDEPEEEVKVYPREPVLESEKSAQKEKFEVGDTVVYTIQTRNTVSDGVVENLVITDELPEGLEFVEGSLSVSHDGEATFTDGVITANFGDVTDTEWRKVTFEAKVLAGQSGKEIENTATVDGDNIDEPDEPTTTVTVEPKDPKLESNKSSTLEKKAEGNTDADNPEVGDTIRYTITTKNTIEDSLVENLVITDEIPEGLTYVAGSLEVNGESVTDSADKDAGHVVDNNVTGNFGDITDTKDYTVTFLVTVDEGQAGKDITNIAEITGDNTDIDEPEEEVKVYPREPVLESEKSAQNLEEGKEKFEVGDTVVYTIQTRNTVSDGVVENLVITDELPEGLEFVEGSLSVSHDGEATFTDGVITANFGDVTDTEWRKVTFEAKVLAGQSGKEIENTATVDGDNIDEPDEPTTTVTVEPKDPKLESNKSSTLEKKAEGNTDADNPEVGDTIRYTITTKNTIEDSLVENLVITDEIPEGLTYVAGSLEVNGESVTDSADKDAGHVVDNNVTGNFGDITDTKDYTVTFLVTVDEGQAGKDITNIAEITGDNTDIDEPEEEVKVYPREPVLESEKSAQNLEEGKEKFEVGDTVVYTIQTRNTVSDGVVENLVITDELPEGLEFVEGSLSVSHDGEATFTDGVITANFGDVTDTEWRKVTFEAKVLAGQSGKEIENTATVDGDNIDEPDEPTTTVTVEPKDPKLESNKSSTLEKKAEGNTDADNPEVGDTIRYTITTKNTIEDSLVENLVITDEIPEGLTYVAGSLEVNGESVTDSADKDAGHVVDNNVTGNFGDITDTKDYTVTFLVTVDEGQAGKDITNIAEITGDNTDIDEPEEEVKVYPREPVLESEKSAQKEKFEVGDTVVYTIQTRNTVSDGVVENLVITDELPEGLEFVEGSLSVSHDGEATFTDGVITANFGDVTDTEWRKVTFEAKVLAGQSGKEIENTATVDGDNIDEPDEPTTTVTVEPKDPKLESNKSSTLEKKAEGNTDADNPEVGDTIRYTITTKNTIEDSLVENLVITDEIPEGLTYVAGSLEVNGESVTDSADKDAGHVADNNVTGNFGDITDTKDYTVTFLVTVDEGQAGKDITNIAEITGDNTDIDEPEEEVKVYPREPVLESEKSAQNLEEGKEKFEVGDTVVYTIQTRNTVSDGVVENLVITDELPEGLEFVEGSLSVSHDGEATFTDGVITANFGDVTDTEWRKVTFEAKVLAGQSGKEIENIATVGGSNTGDPDRPQKIIKVEPKDGGSANPEPPVEPQEPIKPTDPEPNGGSKLPKTATNIFNLIIVGLGLMGLGLLIRFLKKRRTV